VELNGIVDALKDFIWPEECAAGLTPIASPLCTCCGVPFDSAGPDHLCAECLTDPPRFVRARAVYEYGASARDAVLRLKYGKMQWVGETLGRLLCTIAAAARLPDILVPVPLHAKRLTQRGFNQAALLAAPSAALLGRPIRANVIKRVLETSPQAGQTRQERFANLRGAFVCDKPSAVQGKRILILDDVITTGATVREVSRILNKAGAQSVEVIAFARTC
jgi:ComF family protein